MAQKVNVAGFKLAGRPYTGTDENGGDVFLADGLATARWLAHTSRVRFNQQRSLRSKYVYVDNVRQVDASGEPVLAPIGSTVTALTNGQAKKQLPFMAAMPSMVMMYQMQDENRSWFAATKRRSTNMARGMKAGSMPRFKSRRKAALSFGCYARNGAQQVLTFHKTGKRSGILSFNGFNSRDKVSEAHPWKWTLTIRVRLPQNMVITDFTSIQVNLDTMRLVFTTAPKPITRTMTGAVAGLDVGVKVSVATSDGALHTAPDTRALERKHQVIQRRMGRNRAKAAKEGRDWKDSRRYQDLRAEAGKVQGRVNNIRTHFRHVTTTRLIRDYDYLAVEDLKIKNMTRSARGTLAAPGRNVAQKRGLNRAMAKAAPGIILGMLEYKAKAAGVHLVAVNPRWTSQRCHDCGHIEAGNRESQAVFHCQSCGHQANADINAACNILARGLNIWDGTRPKQARPHKPGTGSPEPAMAV